MINHSDREIIGGEREQGTRERAAYTCTPPTTWGTPVSLVGFVIYDITTGDATDVSSAVLSGSGALATGVITTPTVHSLTANRKYELHCTFTTATNTLDFIIPIKATR